MYLTATLIVRSAKKLILQDVHTSVDSIKHADICSRYEMRDKNF